MSVWGMSVIPVTDRERSGTEGADHNVFLPDISDNRRLRKIMYDECTKIFKTNLFTKNRTAE